MNRPGITVIGAGLAGCEAAYQIARCGIDVELIEMKPHKKTAAHRSNGFAELVCSNSLKSSDPESASGLLKAEMRAFGSLCMEAADRTGVPAGSALAVDRELFSGYITERIKSHPHIRIAEYEADKIIDLRPVIVSTGPLTTDKLMEEIRRITGSDNLYFYDAAAPVIFLDSVDQSRTFRQSRYGKGSDDYINCPMNECEYYSFISELTNADTAEIRDFENIRVFEACMPVEVMASRGKDTLRFGPMKPVGLIDPATGSIPFACVQLRQDDMIGTLYSPVGFQTRLKFTEQERVFRMIPGLERAEFARYGVMHRNTFLNSPELLDDTYMLKENPGVYFAGQITGVEGYSESMASGMAAGIYAAMRYLGAGSSARFPDVTMTGALAKYISSCECRGFQPMNANFGIIPSLDIRKRISKQERNRIYKERSLDAIDKFRNSLNLFVS